MGTHPNAMLMAVITPDGLTRKTARKIDPKIENVKIVGTEYSITVMEDTYDEGYQLSAKEGDIVLMDFLTYGYGEHMNWEKVEVQKDELVQWCDEFCKKNECSYEIRIGANYW